MDFAHASQKIFSFFNSNKKLHCNFLLELKKKTKFHARGKEQSFETTPVKRKWSQQKVFTRKTISFRAEMARFHERSVIVSLLFPGTGLADRRRQRLADR
ncbi:MAG: hypothetical protein IPH16_13015 [Haliscomenobacter sp.]|nr:hypothetical protein [Haliscomenobacter sp.]